MTTHYKHSPHHPRPQGADLLKKDFKVEDATGKVFGEHLTWDEAWKVKEQVAGARRSTTPAVRLMSDVHPLRKASVQPNPGPGVMEVHQVTNAIPTWSPAEAATAAAAAAAAATQAALESAAQLANVIPISQHELTADEQALIDEVLGDDQEGDEAIDSAIAEAEAAVKTAP